MPKMRHGLGADAVGETSAIIRHVGFPYSRCCKSGKIVTVNPVGRLRGSSPIIGLGTLPATQPRPVCPGLPVRTRVETMADHQSELASQAICGWLKARYFFLDSLRALMGLQCRLELCPTPTGIILTLIPPDGRKFGHDVCIIADGYQDLGRRWDMVCGHLTDEFRVLGCSTMAVGFGNLADECSIAGDSTMAMVCGNLASAFDITHCSPMEMGRDYLSNMLKSGLTFLRATEDACKWPGIDAGRLDAIKEARAWVAETMRDLNCEYPLVPRSLWSLPADSGPYFKAMEIEEKRYERCRQAIRLVVCDSEIGASSPTVEKVPPSAALAVKTQGSEKSAPQKRSPNNRGRPKGVEAPTAEERRWYKAYCDKKRIVGRVDVKELARNLPADYVTLGGVIKRLRQREERGCQKNVSSVS